ncbi:F0F1 ATP synthase subunit B [Mycoplasma sp. Pen4]|uniref:F0F1 ATP synthase subunit B n=1 Tax=Mycoplasma sp. Pen4 TaxID=640330 RepID=UPI0016548D37|nr:F0F1 ATP synthase subunit B [Mycoplasma sp. Pen4]QNM93725.1 F0F1 ATP synthase subunit B [Mycoplasma sp. Pen4]
MTEVITKLLEKGTDAIDSAEQTAGQGVLEKFKALTPSIPLMIATLIAFGITIAILVYFFYKPVKAMMKRRHDFIQSNIDESITNKEQSLVRLNEANDKLKDAHKQADIIVTKAKIAAGEVAHNFTEKAKAESKRMLEETTQDIASQQREFDLKSKEYIVTVATQLAEEILKREITPQTQSEIIEQFLKSETTPKEI